MKTKKILGVIAVLMMVAVAFAGAASAEVAEGDVARIGDEGYATLHAALNVMKTGQTVTLLTDVTEGGYDFQKAAGTYTIDFGGNTWTVTNPAVGSTGTTNQAMRLWGLNDLCLTSPNDIIVVLKNGTMEKSVEYDGIRAMINSYVDLTLDNFTVDGFNIQRTGDAGNAFIVEVETGKLTLKNGSVIKGPVVGGNIKKTYAIYSYNGAGNYGIAPIMDLVSGEVSGDILVQKLGSSLGWKGTDEGNIAKLNICGATVAGDIQIKDDVSSDANYPEVSITAGTVDVTVSDEESLIAVLDGAEVGTITVNGEIKVGNDSIIIAEGVTVDVPAGRSLAADHIDVYGKLVVDGTLTITSPETLIVKGGAEIEIVSGGVVETGLEGEKVIDLEKGAVVKVVSVGLETVKAAIKSAQISAIIVVMDAGSSDTNAILFTEGYSSANGDDIDKKTIEVLVDPAKPVSPSEGQTVVGLNAGISYEVIIPMAVALSSTTETANYGIRMIAKGGSNEGNVVMCLDGSDNDFNVVHETNTSLKVPYLVKIEDETIGVGGEIVSCAVNAETVETAEVKFELNGTVTLAGVYTDILTFSVEFEYDA